MSNIFEHENNELLETCNYDLELAKEFIEQLEENKIQEEYEMITNTQELIDKIQSMEFLDTDKLKEIAYRLDLFEPQYTFDVKEQILNRVKVIEFNNLGDIYTFESIKNELIDMVKEIAFDYDVNIEEDYRGR